MLPEVVSQRFELGHVVFHGVVSLQFGIKELLEVQEVCTEARRLVKSPQFIPQWLCQLDILDLGQNTIAEPQDEVAMCYIFSILVNWLITNDGRLVLGLLKSSLSLKGPE